MGTRTRRPRSAASYGPEVGTTYLLHFDRPYRHARHYIGWTQDLAARLDAHVRGRGARLIEVITQAGIGFNLARTWPETTRDREDSLKHQGDARRFCPECGVTPREKGAVAQPPHRLSLYEIERGGTWLDGTPLPEITEYPPATAPDQAAHREEPEMFGSKARAERRQQAAERQQQAEADRLFALADELEAQAGERPNYQREITAERAARIRERLGGDLARDARGQIPESQLQGADLEAEIDRLAAVYPEYTPLEFVPWQDRLSPEEGRRAAELQSAAHQIAADNLAAELWPEREAAGRRAEAEADAGAAPDYYRSSPGSDEHRAAYREAFTEARGAGYAVPDDMDLSYEIDNAGELAAERYYEALEERHYRELAGGDGAGDDEAGDDTRPEPDHLYGSPECDEADPETAHFGAEPGEPEDAGHWPAPAPPEPLPRLLEPAGANPVRAPLAVTLPDGTPHSDPALAARGWQAQRGVYVRQPQAQLEAG